IEDTANYIIPAIQPHKGALPSLWKTAQAKDRTVYAEALDKAVREWLSDDSVVNISFVAGNMDLGILRLSLVQADNPRPYQEHTNNSFEDVLGKLWEHVKIPLIGNFQLLPDFRIFIGSDLYLIKPMQKRFWLRSTALADADEIAADLQDALTLNNKAGRGK
ncbi:MAG: N-6 DNA methylase, partial [Nitrospinota bacterium]|nr:N-6 DNA methylase [Nitrospinota bacterium]